MKKEEKWLNLIKIKRKNKNNKVNKLKSYMMKIV